MNSLTIGLLLMALPHPLAQIIACFVLLRAIVVALCYSVRYGYCMLVLLRPNLKK